MIRTVLVSNVSLWGCLWQSTLFVVVGLVGSLVLGRRPARAHQVLLLAMLGAVLVPALSGVVRHFHLGLWVRPAVVPEQVEPSRPMPIETGAFGAVAATEAPPAPRAASSAAPPDRAMSGAAPVAWRTVALWSWAAATCALFGRLLFAFAAGVRLSRRAQPLRSGPVVEALRLAQARLGVQKDLQIRTDTRVRSPVIWCWGWQPVLLVPDGAGSPGDGTDWAGVIAHELAHGKRGDHVTGLLAELVVCALPWHPLLWWSKRHLVSLTERACDDWVVASGQPAEDYAESLLGFRRQNRPAFVPAVVGSKRGVAFRVRRILNDACGNPCTGTKWAVGVTILVMCVVLGFAFAQARPAEPKTSATNREAPTSLSAQQKAGRSAQTNQAAAAQPVSADAQANSITLSGRVLDPQGTPAAGAEVTFYLETPGEIGVLLIVTALDRKITGADGAFAFAAPKTAKDYREGHVIARKAGLALAWATWPMQGDQRLELRLSAEPKELAGDVVDEAGRPIAEAVVHIALAKIGKGENRRELRSTGYVRTKTDRNGHFVFPDMPAGATFEFLVEAPGRAPVGTIDISVYGREQCQFAPGQAGIRFTLPPEARIEGVVVEKGGKPVGGIEVAAHSDRRGRGAPVPSQRAVTASDGTFRLGSLSDGTSIVSLWTARGQKPEWVAEDVRLPLTAGQTRREVRMEITKGAFLDALIKDTTGKPVEKVGVYFRRVGQEQGFGSSTDVNGLARIRVLPGAYSLSQIFRPGYAPPETTDPVTVAEGQTQRVEYIVTAKPKVAGIVRDEAGHPLAGIKVQATWIRMLSAMTGGAVSDASGKFEFPWDTTSLARGGAATVIFVARDPVHNLVQALDIDESTGPLDLKLKPGVIVTGTVLNPAGQPLPGANARVLLKVDRAATRLGWDEMATAGPDGVFEFKAVPPERQCTVEVTADGYGKQNVPIATLDPKETRHDIGRIKLVASGLSVSGVVVDANDQPVAGMEVSAYGDGQPDLRTAATDAKGRFTIKGVCPGSVRLMVSAPLVSPLRGSAQAEAGATDVKVTVVDRRFAQTYVPRKGTVLKGKPLPSLKDLGIDLPSEAEGKMLLICFWDMSQRPSRAWLTQLAAQASPLGERGVIVVPVQAAKVEPDTLSQWLTKLPFKLATISGDIDKTKLAWGVASLPHLILTDKKHMVVAEGFGVDELDKQIEAASR